MRNTEGGMTSKKNKKKEKKSLRRTMRCCTGGAKPKLKAQRATRQQRSR